MLRVCPFLVFRAPFLRLGEDIPLHHSWDEVPSNPVIALDYLVAPLVHEIMWSTLPDKDPVLPTLGPVCPSSPNVLPACVVSLASAFSWPCALVHLTSVPSRKPLRIKSTLNHPLAPSRLCSSHFSSIVVAADGLFKRRIFYSPNPFAYITVDAEQPRWTRTIKNTLNPYWNESFDL